MPAPKAAPAAAGSGVGVDLLPWPKVDFTKFAPVELKPLSRIKKISGANLARNWAMIPHVTQHDEADVTDLEEFRKSSNEAIASLSGRAPWLPPKASSTCAPSAANPHEQRATPRDGRGTGGGSMGFPL